MSLCEKIKKIKIDSLNNDRLMLVAVLKNLKENVEIQMVLNRPMMEILEVRVCTTVKEGNKWGKTDYNLNILVGQNLRYGFDQIKKEIEELKITRSISELFVEICCTSMDFAQPCVVNLKQTE